VAERGSYDSIHAQGFTVYEEARAKDYRKPAPQSVEPETPKPEPINGAGAHVAGDLTFTDLENAKRLVRCHGVNYRHCHPWRKDLVWNGRAWIQDQTGQVERWAKDTIRQLYTLAAAEADDCRRKAIYAGALKSESAKRLRDMAALSRSEPGMPILPGQLDRDGMLLNVHNGTLDLRSGELRPHRREDYLTKLCPVAYDPRATCPLWERFLADIFPATGDAAEQPGNTELILFVQRFLGYCLSGDVSEQVLTVFWGKGANGKSTLLNVLLEVLGQDYAIKAPTDLLVVKRDAHPTEKADLFGSRLVAAIETEDGAKLAESLVKDLTGGERIRARRMREDFWEFAPTHKLILCTNHKPKIRGTDHAIWRRIRLVPFTVIIPPERQDKQLLDKLRGEYPGILAWLVRGFLAWKQEGVSLPADVKAATQEYRDEQDLLAGFIKECCIVKLGDSNYRCRANQLYARFVKWVEGSGEGKGSEVPSQRKVGEALIERGFGRHLSNGTWYLGIGLRQESEEELPE
jgi:putative DNA primase/helicase